MTGMTVGFALCGSFCTIDKAIFEMEKLVKEGAEVIPIMSEIVQTTSTRFGDAETRLKRVEEITQKEVLKTIKDVEPIGPKGLLDLLIISPCTGNTISKIATGITDSTVTMAAKAHLRNNRPLLLSIATNDALSGSAANIGKLLNTKNVYFVPFGQDDPIKKSTSMICDFNKILPAAKAALEGKQIQPILI
ncbi:MAG: dipicolinate synthase subunit B [Ruminococcaceae bacterium]|nr:dipicolinate synthase subunit B [Oscillospiraceae bacterium]